MPEAAGLADQAAHQQLQLRDRRCRRGRARRPPASPPGRARRRPRAPRSRGSSASCSRAHWAVRAAPCARTSRDRAHGDTPAPADPAGTRRAPGCRGAPRRCRGHTGGAARSPASSAWPRPVTSASPRPAAAPTYGGVARVAEVGVGVDVDQPDPAAHLLAEAAHGQPGAQQDRAVAAEHHRELAGVDDARRCGRPAGASSARSRRLAHAVAGPPARRGRSAAG